MLRLFVEALLEIAFIITYISMCVKDSKNTRTLTFSFYTAYVLVTTGLAVYEIIKPSKGWSLMEE